MKTIRGTTALCGQDRSDGLVQMLVRIIEIARDDAGGNFKACDTRKAHWQQDAIEFLESLSEVKADILLRR